MLMNYSLILTAINPAARPRCYQPGQTSIVPPLTISIVQLSAQPDTVTLISILNTLSTQRLLILLPVGRSRVIYARGQVATKYQSPGKSWRRKLASSTILWPITFLIHSGDSIVRTTLDASPLLSTLCISFDLCHRHFPIWKCDPNSHRLSSF